MVPEETKKRPRYRQVLECKEKRVIMRRIERDNTGLMKPGQDLVMAGYAGWAGTLRIADLKRAELEQWFRPSYIENMLQTKWESPENTQSFWRSVGAAEWEEAGEGGVFAALWRLSGAYMTGVEFWLRDIPLRQETVELCERYELNPYRLLSEGAFVLAGDNGLDLVRNLREKNIPAAVIGKVTTGIGRVIRSQDGTGYLERPGRDEIEKILHTVT